MKCINIFLASNRAKYVFIIFLKSLQTKTMVHHSKDVTCARLSMFLIARTF